MINHARTLLLNMPGRDSSRENPGEEYIPPDFAPVVLPSYLVSARRLLLGTAPDRYFLNFRAHELMRYLHETELADYVYRLDPRVTYWPETTTPLLDKDSRISVAQALGPTDTKLFFNGRPGADNSRGRCLYDFVVSVVTEGGNTVVRAEQVGGHAAETVVAPGSNLSEFLPLGPTGVQVRVSKPTPGSRWTVTTLAKPAPAISTVLPALELIGEPTLLELFGVLTTTEPYATFRNLWTDNRNPVYRLGGFVLAMIYRTDEVRKKGANG